MNMLSILSNINWEVCVKLRVNHFVTREYNIHVQFKKA